MTKGISSDLAGLAEAYGVEGDTPDAILKGLRAHVDKLSDSDRQVFLIANGGAVADAEFDLMQERNNAARQADTARGHESPVDALERYADTLNGRETVEGEHGQAQRDMGTSVAFPQRMTPEEQGAALWQEAQAIYDFGDMRQAQIERIAQSVSRERGYQVGDFNNAALRREFIGQVGEALGLKLKAGKPAKEDDNTSRTTSLSYGGKSGGSTSGRAKEADSGDDNMAFLRGMAEIQHKAGVR